MLLALTPAGASATAGSERLPLVGSSIPVGCTYNNGCAAGYHGAAAKAIDFSVPSGTRVYATGGGSVRAVGGCPNSRNDSCNGGAGNYIEINHGTHVSRYLHLSGFVVKSGNVSAGALIAYSGNSGWSEGAHLHYDEKVGATKVDAGALQGCHGVTPVRYGAAGWNKVGVGSRLRNDGYSCTSTPRGKFESAGTPGAGTVKLTGWSFDGDARTTALQMHAYIGGKAGQPGAIVYSFTANGSRPDVNNVYPGVGNNHGLNVTFPTSKRGAQSVCLYAINRGAGSNVGLGCKNVTIANPDPIGKYEELVSPAAGQLRIKAWTIDPNDRKKSLAMHAYVGGNSLTVGAEKFVFTAKRSRPDVGAAHAGAGNSHGLSEVFKTTKQGLQKVCLYAINIGPGANKSLGCKDVRIAAAQTDVQGNPSVTVIRRTLRISRKDCRAKRLRLKASDARITKATRVGRRSCRLVIRKQGGATGKRTLLVKRRGKFVATRRSVRIG